MSITLADLSDPPPAGVLARVCSCCYGYGLVSSWSGNSDGTDVAHSTDDCPICAARGWVFAPVSPKQREVLIGLIDKHGWQYGGHRGTMNALARRRFVRGRKTAFGMHWELTHLGREAAEQFVRENVQAKRSADVAAWFAALRGEEIFHA